MSGARNRLAGAWLLATLAACGGEGDPLATPPQILTSSLPEGRVGDPYAVVIEVQGGAGPYAFEHTFDVPGLRVDDGGRPVAVLRTPAGRWVACNAYLADLCATPGQAAQRLEKLLKSARRGYVACLAMDRAKAHAAGVLSAQPAGCRNAQLSPGQKRR